MTWNRTLLTLSAISMLAGSGGIVAHQWMQPALADPPTPQVAQAGNGAQGRPDPDAHLAAAAAELGVSEADLKAALGLPAERPEPDLAGAAAQLGISETELQTALRNSHQTDGRRGGPPDLAAVAAQYGVTVDELAAALGVPAQPPRPDLAAAATKLGVSEDALRQALRPPGCNGGDPQGPNRNGG